MTTTETTIAERDAIVGDPWVAEGLTRAGVPATTFGAILDAGDIATMVRLAGSEPAVLFPTPRSFLKSARVEARLRRLGIAFRVVRELVDWRGSS